jgi:hypothetical protein
MVKKKDGSWRPCGDYHQLSMQTMEDKYPLPNMADIAARLDGCTIFIKFYLRKATCTVRSPPILPRWLLSHHSGYSSFICMSFGLRNVGMTFQWLMDSLLNGLLFTFAFLDTSSPAQTQLSTVTSAAKLCRHLCTVFSLLD